MDSILANEPRKHGTHNPLWLLAILLAATIGCHRGTNAPQDPQSVIAFVAASTTDAVREIASAFHKDKKIEVKINADDSSKLAMQIGEGAPAHVFLSANEKWAEFVKEKGFAQETKVLLGNALVIVVPKGNPAGVKEPKDLTSPAITHVAVAGPTVPAGIYARQSLRKLNLWDDLEKNKKLVSGENVRVTLSYVERGEAEAGIVYATDGKISDKVETVYTFDASVHDPIRYPLVLLEAGQQVPAARALFDYLQTPSAADVFNKHGFIFLGGK